MSEKIECIVTNYILKLSISKYSEWMKRKKRKKNGDCAMIQWYYDIIKCDKIDIPVITNAHNVGECYDMLVRTTIV